MGLRYIHEKHDEQGRTTRQNTATTQAGKRGGHTKVALVFCGGGLFQRFVRSWKSKKKSHVGDVKCWNPAGFPQVAREGSPSGDLGARARHTPGHYVRAYELVARDKRDVPPPG